MKKQALLTGLMILLMASTAWAGNSVTITMSCTIPSIPGVNAPALIPEASMSNYQRQDIANKNSTATVGVETIEKVEKKETLLAQGGKVTTNLKTIYVR